MSLSFFFRDPRKSAPEKETQLYGQRMLNRAGLPANVPRLQVNRLWFENGKVMFLGHPFYQLDLLHQAESNIGFADPITWETKKPPSSDQF